METECITCKKRFKYSPSNKKGLYCSIKCRDKDPNYINPMKGKKRPDLTEYNKIHKPLQIKEKNPNWRGGTAREGYDYIFNDKLKGKIRERDNHSCQICGIKESYKNHDIHHIDYNKKNSIPLNLITLCESCHAKTNFNRESWKEFFREFVLQRLKKKYGKLAILINYKDRPTELSILLQSLRTQHYQNFDIFILDDQSGTPLNAYHFMGCILNRLKCEGHNVFYRRTDFQHGVSRARQAIVDWAMEGDYGLFARYDDDIVLEPDYQEKLLGVLELDFDIASGVTVPMMIPVFKRDPKYLNGTINRVILDKEGNYVFCGDDCGWEYTESKILPAHHFRSCALIKREVHNKVKYYPTKLTIHGFREEQIFSYKAQLNGFKIGVDTQAINYHQLTPSGGERFPESQQMSQQNNQVLKEFTKERAKELNKLFPQEPKLNKELMKETNLLP
jgi:GT2 family glycosyltransferase